MNNNRSKKGNIAIVLCLCLVVIWLLSLLFTGDSNTDEGNNDFIESVEDASQLEQTTSSNNNNDDSNKNNSISRKKYYNLSKSTGGLPQPEQTACPRTTITMNVKGTEVAITKLARYKIIGRIVSIGYYSGKGGVVNTMSTRDFYLAFGVMALDRNVNRARFSSPTRRGMVYCDNQEFLKEYANNDILNNCLSNNHLINSTDKIRKEVEKAKIGDVVQIEGFLVYAEWKEGNGLAYWGPSSLSRTDSGDGACEIIYVEGFKIIQ